MNEIAVAIGDVARCVGALVEHTRDALPAGKKYSGPAVITEYSATTVVPPGVSFGRDLVGNLIIEIGYPRGNLKTLVGTRKILRD